MTARKRVLIICGFQNADILAGFLRYAREAKWVVNIYSVLHGHVPKGWRADGLLTTNVFRGDLLRFVLKTGVRIPTVIHGCNDLGLDVPNVEVDEHAAGKMAAEHFLELGHRHFAWFRYSRNLHALRRCEGFQLRLRAEGRDCLSLEKISPHGSGAGAWFCRRFARLPKPLGLFLEDDLLASTVIETALESRLRVPEDLAVIGCGNLPVVCDMSPVPITSISLPMEESAYLAAALLDQQFSGPVRAPRCHTLPPGRLVERGSTDLVVATRPVVRRAMTVMLENLSDPELTAAVVAKTCGVSLRLLYQEFENDIHSSPMRKLLQFRIRSAKRLLLTTDRKINVISEETGFANLRTFQRAFRRIDGVSPSLSRKSAS